MAIETVKVPDLGGAENVEVIEIAVAAGDEIAEEGTLLVLESDKASMDVPSPVAGVVKKVLVKLGDTVSRDTPIVEVEVETRGSTDSEAEAGQEAPASKEKSGQADASQAGSEPRDDAESPEKSGEKKPQNKPATKESAEQPLRLPDLGTDEEVDVIELGVAVGDRVAEGDALMTLEGDKATMDVPSPVEGTITALTVKEGDKVKSGQEIGSIEVSGGKATADDSADEQADSGKKEEAGETPEKPQDDTDAATEEAGKASQSVPSAPLNEPEAPASEVYAGPMVRQFARELGIDLRNVDGTGVKGRIQRDDVKDYVKSALKSHRQAGGTAPGGGIPGIPDQDFSQYGEVEDVALTRVGKLTASNMHRVWLNAPMVTQFDDADITELEAFRKSLKPESEKRGVKVTPVAFLMKACAAVLATNPVLNRSWHSSGEKVIQKHYVHIGMAVDTPKGLLVPVIRDVDRKGIFDIAEDIAAMAEKARDGKLSSADMQGGSFSISSLGAIGGRGFTPIVNAPEAAILGVSKASIQPVWNGKEFVPRQLLPLSLTYDHKLVNGADAGRFLTDLVAVLGDMRRLLL